MEKKEDDCGKLQERYFRSHGRARTKAWEQMSFFCRPYTWVRHKLRKTHKMIRPDRTGCYVDAKNTVTCNNPHPTNKDIIWLTKEQSDHHKDVLKKTPVLPDTAEPKHSKAETTRAGYVADENNPWAKYPEIESGDAWGERNRLDEFPWAEHSETKHGDAWGERNYLGDPWAEHPETKGHAWAESKYTDESNPGYSKAELKRLGEEFNWTEHLTASYPTIKPVYIHIKKYGILSGNPADKNIVIVDPAGDPFLSNNSKGALGASKSIYKFLDNPTFPPDLLSGFKRFDARYHEYTNAVGTVRVIHTIGPNGAAKSKREFDKFMLPGLTETYKNVFKEFIKCGKHTLRLLLVSGGVYSGENDISTVTYEAISAALEKLSPQDLATLGDKNIEMCLFSSDPRVYKAHKELCSTFDLCPSLSGGRKTVKRRQSPRSSPPRSGRSRTRSRSRF